MNGLISHPAVVRGLILAATVKESLTVQVEGSRQVQRSVTRYNLDAILAVGTTLKTR